MLSKAGSFGGVAKAIFAVLLGAVVMTGCATRDPRLLDALKGTRVTQVRVESPPDVSTGLLPMMNGMTSTQQVSMIVAALQKVAARDLRGYPGGQIPTRLVITLQQADLASEPGRILRGGDSFIAGTVRLENAATGKLIAQNPRITGEDRGMRGSGLGVVVAIAVNAATTKNQEHLAEKLAVSFTQNVKAWLSPK